MSIEPHTHMAFRLSYPDSDTSAPFITAFDLAPITEGTHVTIEMTWSRHHGRRSLLSPLL